MPGKMTGFISPPRDSERILRTPVFSAGCDWSLYAEQVMVVPGTKGVREIIFR